MAKLVPEEWWARRGVRWGVVITVWVVLYGAFAAFLHFVLHRSWTDTLVFVVVQLVINLVVQWLLLRGQQPTPRRPG
ncbi:hypothetical protein ABZS76_34665 [Streptomyces sp. NPDC005562]|uniref:hypothetical protein n=1 Tax=Streptomyces sp. NPDC005562 TaxID=3154890 RepID=UPI0033BE46E4